MTTNYDLTNPEDQVVYYLTLNVPNFDAASSLIKQHGIESKVGELAARAISQITDDRPIYDLHGKKPGMYMKPTDQIRRFTKAYNAKFRRLRKIFSFLKR